jgi:uncharacterized surface protein with fasciclin (FAS1) repeats
MEFYMIHKKIVLSLFVFFGLAANASPEATQLVAVAKCTLQKANDKEAKNLFESKSVSFSVGTSSIRDETLIAVVEGISFKIFSPFNVALPVLTLEATFQSQGEIQRVSVSRDLNQTGDNLAILSFSLPKSKDSMSLFCSTTL